MVSMFGLKASYGRGAAATACLLMLALLVGPLCTPLCAGSSCLAQTTRSNVEASCHGMSSQGGGHFAASPNGGRCGAAEASLAVLSKLSLSVKSGVANNQELVLAAPPLSAKDIFAARLRLNFSSGPPLEIQSPSLSNLVLRI